jgi:Tfp pilus assembly protein PilO
MKAGEKTINLLACIALVLSAGFGVKALELCNERQLAVEQTQKLQGQLTQQIRFANEHSDYKTYQITLLEKQKKLEQQVEHNLNLNNILQRLQKQARAQSIHLNSMQMEGKHVALQNGLQMQKLQISAVGDFYSLLRWLRQAERDGCKVKELRLQSVMQEKEVLKMELSLEFYIAN